MNTFNRESLISLIESEKLWDVVVIGGGASGLGAALDSVTRGLKTLLVEQEDFTKGTSSRSTKLVHGGVRYLAQGNIALVLEALRERGLMKLNAPHLVKDQSFIIPSYKWWVTPFYTIGLTLYDLMAGRLGLGRSLPYSRTKTLNKIPTLKKEGLRGGVVYHDGQFDDARYGINLCQTIIEKGGTALNYMQVINLIKTDSKISGVQVIDKETQKEYKINAKIVINATGVFVDNIVKMDTPMAKNIVCVSQGVHLVLDKEFVPNDYAIMIPKTADGRVLFAVPWHNKVVVGTTDIKKETAELEPKALDEEIDFILETAGRFLAKPPKRSDVKSVFAGLRPLASPTGDCKKTKEISRGHKIVVSDAGLITITGGKWTTYRKMAEEVIDEAVKVMNIKAGQSCTEHMKIHGWKEQVDLTNPLYYYGTDEQEIINLIKQDASLGELLSKELMINKAQVVLAARFEMARTVEDFLARRTRTLMLDARESARIAPQVAEILASELGKDADWQQSQLKQFKTVSENYILN